MKIDFKSLKPKKKFRKGGLHIDPEVYWVSALGFTTIMILIMIAFGYIQFRRVNSDYVATEDANIQINRIDKPRIDRALEYFNKRALTSEEIINNPAPVVDPSR